MVKNNGKYSIQLQTNEPNGNKTIDIKNLHDYYTTGVSVNGSSNNANVQFNRNNGEFYSMSFTAGGGNREDGDTYVQIGGGTTNEGIKLFTGSKVIANNNVSLDVYKGEILSILGENGCGKTTLMNMVAGIYYPDSGKILINGEEVIIRSPRDAFEHKIGMIHQHFKLIDIFTAAQNVALGIENEKYNLKEVNNRIKEMAEKYGFNINLDKKIYEMSVSEKQTVEILKVLYRGADILILDEPTAVLTPQEIKSLFKVLNAMRNDGKSIIIITHKLNEVMEISDRISVMRQGQYMGTVNVEETSPLDLTKRARRYGKSKERRPFIRHN